MNLDFPFTADEINRLTSSDFQRYLMGDRSTKLELILAGKFFSYKSVFTNSSLDEERIRDITKNLSKIDTLAQALDGEYFQGISNLLNSSF